VEATHESKTPASAFMMSSACSKDLSALRYAVNKGMVVITCNRGDFLRLAETESHVGIIILVRRRTRVAECAGVLRLLERAGESGIANNINFA